MKKSFILTFVFILLAFVSANAQNDCRYWFVKVDPNSEEVDFKIDEKNPQNIINGIECLLTLEGKRRVGVRYGSKPNVSQLVPKASIEINALYKISELFYGNDNFAGAVALIGEDDNLKVNSKRYVKKAFASYRKWFEKVKEIGLDEARKQKLDPLANSGVRWY
jgi:hypothetical protein